MRRYYRPSVLGALAGVLFLSLIALPGATATADHLLISEFHCVTRIPANLFGSPYIEITNPTAGDIDLSDVFITDAAFEPSARYWLITMSDPLVADPGGAIATDFHACFPPGAVLAAGDTLAISLNGSAEYFDAYERLPDFELYEDGLAPDGVPEMREAFPGAIDAGLGRGDDEPGLDRVGESIVLYSWDRVAHLVKDLDYVVWGTNLAGRVDKTGQSAGGEAYLADTPADLQQPVAAEGPGFTHAFARRNDDEGTETTTGGNGLTGHDETSEPLAMTWIDNAFQSPPSAPPVFFPAAPIITDLVLPRVPIEAEPTRLEVRVEAFTGVADVIFFYRVDGGPFIPLIALAESAELWSTTVPGHDPGTLIEWYVETLAVGGGVAVAPPAAPLYLQRWIVRDALVYPDKILITEVSTIGTDQEYIEIWNPNATDVDLNDYYLSDAIFTPGNQVYWRIAEGDLRQEIVGGGAFADFHARFPDGFSLAAGDTAVIAVRGSDQFFHSFGYWPALELWEDDLDPDTVPDMRWIFGDQINNSIINRTGTGGGQPSIPGLTNGGESIVLYHWDGESDAVTDVDVFHWKDPSSTSSSYFFDKTGVVIGSHSYLPDTAVDDQTPFPVQAAFGLSYHRLDANEGDQITSGSNGVLGHDETSEDFPNTFGLAPYDPAGMRGGISAVSPESRFANHLIGAHPNPFNPSTLIAFSLAGEVAVDLEIFDVRGRRVRRLVRDEVRPPGRHRVEWRGQTDAGTAAPSGVYFYRLQAGDFAESRRMVLIR